MASDLEWFENPAPLPIFNAGTADEKPISVGPASHGTGGADDERPAKRRRNRVKMSCRACQARKLRCDKQPSQESCDGCISESIPRLCSDVVDQLTVFGPCRAKARVQYVRKL